MIHSLSGGVVKGESFFDFAKVEIDGEGFFWFIDPFGLEESDIVVVPFGGETRTGKILRIDKHVSSFAAPVPTKHAKKILECLNRGSYEQ